MRELRLSSFLAEILALSSKYGCRCTVFMALQVLSMHATHYANQKFELTPVNRLPISAHRFPQKGVRIGPTHLPPNILYVVFRQDKKAFLDSNLFVMVTQLFSMFHIL